MWGQCCWDGVRSCREDAGAFRDGVRTILRLQGQCWGMEGQRQCKYGAGACGACLYCTQKYSLLPRHNSKHVSFHYIYKCLLKSKLVRSVQPTNKKKTEMKKKQ